MTWSAPSVKSFLDAVMVTTFNAASTAPLDVWAAGYIGASNASAPVTDAQVQKLGAAYGGTAYFNSLYGSLNSTQFLNAISVNLTGAPLTASQFLTYSSMLTSYVTAYGNVNVARGVLAAEMTQGVIGAQPSDFVGSEAMLATALNRAAASTSYANASATSTFLVPTSVSPTDAGWVASQNILTGINFDAATLARAQAEIAQAQAVGNTSPIINQGPAPGINYTLTTAIETVPPQGTLGLNATVSGVSQAGGAAGGETWNTGDTINGGGAAAANIINLLGNGNTAATGEVVNVNNVARINTNLVANTALNAVTWAGVDQSWVTNSSAAGNTLTLINGALATTYGVYDASVATVYNVGIRAGDLVGASDKVNLAVKNAGAAGVQTAINLTSAGAEALAIATAGAANNVVVTGPGNGIKAITITGDAAKNTINVGAAGISTTAAVTVDASKVTGDIVVDIGAAASAGGISVAGSTGAGTTTLGLITTAASVLNTITDVEAVQIDTGSAAASVLIAAGNTTVKKVTVQDQAGGSAYTLQGFSGITALEYQTLGGQANTFGAVNIPTSNANLAVSFAKQNAASIGAGNTLTVGALNVNGTTALTIDTANGVGSTTAANFGVITDNTLTSLKVTDASTGLLTLAGVDATNAAGTAGLLSTLDLSGVAGTVNVTVDAAGFTGTLASNAVLTGAKLGSVINFFGDQGVAFTTNLTGNNTFNGGVQTGALTVISNDVAGNVDTITTGFGNDFITVGLGANTINAGGGANAISINAASTSLNTINHTVAGSTDTITGFNADIYNFNAGAGTVNLGAGHTAGTVNVNAAVVATVNQLNGDTVNMNVSVATLTEGAHTTGTIINQVAPGAGAFALTVNGSIAADVINLSDVVAANNVTLTLGGNGSNAINLTGDGAGAGRFTLNLAATTGSNTVNWVAADTTATNAINISGDLTVNTSGASVFTVNDTTNGGTITLSAGHTGVNTIAVVANAGNSTTFGNIVNSVVGDIVDFTGAVGAVNNASTVFGTVAAGVAATAALGGAGDASNFIVGGNTYVLQQTAAGVLSAGDTLVELTGIHTIALSGTDIAIAS